MKRVVRPEGLVVAAFISRASVFHDGFLKGWVDSAGAIQMMADVARCGFSDRRSGSGAVSYFHTSVEAREELMEAGLNVI